jgi:hypothetical protein
VTTRTIIPTAGHEPLDCVVEKTSDA